MYIMHNDAAYHAHQSHYLTGERSWNMNEQNEQNRTEQNKTEQNRTEPNRTPQIISCAPTQAKKA